MMAIFGLIFGLLTMGIHFIIVTLELIEKTIPILGWLIFIPNAILILLRTLLAIVTDKLYPEGNMRAKILAITTNLSEEEAEKLTNTANVEESDIYKYDDVEFDESDFNVAIHRSMMNNNEWTYFHTNLNGAIEFLINDGWKYLNNGTYVFPIALNNAKYKQIELGYDDDNFPVLRADSVNTLSENY